MWTPSFPVILDKDRYIPFPGCATFLVSVLAGPILGKNQIQQSLLDLVTA